MQPLYLTICLFVHVYVYLTVGGVHRAHYKEVVQRKQREDHVELPFIILSERPLLY